MAMKPLVVCLLFLAAAARAGDVRQARQLMEQNQPLQAGEVLRGLRSQKPDDPWLAYDAGVAAYAARDYSQADQIWQNLAARDLPPKLRDRVWTQIGNVSFRFGEQTEAKTPEQAVPQYEQSREAYRIVLAARPRDSMAAHNLKVVELRLARLHAQLARRLLDEARNKGLQETIDKLQAALDHQRTAQELDPQNAEYKQDTQKTEQRLSEKFTEKGALEEKKADRTLNEPTPNPWEVRQAAENLRTALADFQEAEALDPANRQAPEGVQRVQQKLANLLAKEGRQLQHQAESEEQWNTDEAVDHYEQALEKFDEALSLQENHQDAQAGQEEVKDALERLHEKRGDQLAREGRQELPHRPDDAAEKMVNALDHYQEAQAINPDNQTVPPKIEALEKELPPLLNSLGKQEQQAAAQAEPRSAEKAIAHLEKAATSYEMSQQLDEDNPEAQQGQDQVQKDLARLREKVAREAEAKHQQQQQAQQQAQQTPQQNQQQQQQQQQSQESFQSLLSQIKDPEKQRQYDESRRGQTKKYDPDQNRIFKNW